MTPSPTPQPPLAPPRWPRAVLHFVLPRDPMRDGILGDLHEEFVRDAVLLGRSPASMRYQRRAVGVIVHATLDSLRCRSWASTTPPVELPHAPVASSAGTPPDAAGRPRARARAGRGDAGLAVVAFGVLSVGIVANTVLFTAVRSGPRPAAPAGSALSSAIGIGAMVLALACAGVAALVLCMGPRWLRRRLHRR